MREAQAIDGIFVGEHGGKPRGGYAALFAHSNASRKLPERTNSFKKIMRYFDDLWAQTVDPKRPVKRINLGFGNLVPENLPPSIYLAMLRPMSASATWRAPSWP